MSEAIETKIGSHSVRFESPDVFVVRFEGEVSGPELNDVAAAMKRPGVDEFFVIINATDMGSFSNEAKKNIRVVPLAKGIAVFGASTQLRVVLSILNKVYMMVYMGADNPIRFVDTQDDAYRWISERRHEIAKRG